MMHSNSYILHLPLNMYLVFVALFLAGIMSGHLIIPPIDEMIEEGQKTLNIDSNNDV